MDDWLVDVPGRIAAKLKNFYVYFWRWATWKVWESTPAEETGVVCFITTSGYLAGSAFTGMRRYIREHASVGWIIDLTPEGQTPDVPTRVFPGVRQPLAIGIFLRTPETTKEVPADLRYIALHGRRGDKFASLQGLSLTSDDWRPVRSTWTAPFTAAAVTAWDDWPSVDQLMPWFSPGVFPTRTWVYSPSEATLKQRWSHLTAEPDLERRRALMKDSTGAMDSKFKDLPGHEHPTRLPEINSLHAASPMEPTVIVGYRAFDRQRLIADPRLIHRARAGLWAASALHNQVYVVEQHTKQIRTGPGLVFSGYLPDFDHFKGSEGGRTLPYLHPDGSPNFAPGLIAALSAELGVNVTADDALAYIAAVAAHPGFTQSFLVELETPGVRIPITKSPALWSQAVELGTIVLWVQTYGRAFASGAERPSASVAFPKSSPERILNHTAVSELPTGYDYDPQTQEIKIGGGTFGPVGQDVIDYDVGGRRVVKSWIDYRAKQPAGKRSSALDDVIPTSWEHAWTQEFNELLTLITRLVALEPKQDELLHAILDEPLLTTADLAASGVIWPTSDRDRKPRHGAADPGQAVLDLDG